MHQRCVRPVVLFFACLVCLLPRGAKSAEQNTLTPEELDQGWILLFDGESLFGWTPGSDANWKAHDGVISVTEGSQGLALHEQRVWRISAARRFSFAGGYQ